jgi:hypothetical protein
MRFATINTDTFLKVLDGIAWRSGSTIEDIAHFSGFGASTVRNAVNNARELKLASVGTNGSSCCVTIEPRFRTKLSRDEQLVIVREQLQNCQFFQIICEFLARGEAVDAAIRKAAAISGKQIRDSKHVLPLLHLAADVGLLEKTGARFQISSSIPVAPTEEAGILTSQLDTEMAAVLFVSNRLGSDVFHSLAFSEQTRICRAVRLHSSDLEKSTEDAGKALESYLRVIGHNAGHDLKSFNGVAEIADFLGAPARMVIHPKHRDLIKATSAVRNCSAHERDKFTNQPWRKTPEMALTNVLWTLHIMRSLALWIKSREQIL